MADSRRRILVANSDGMLAEDDQVKTLFAVQCVAIGDTGMQTGYESIGRTIGWELFDRVDVEEHARKVARQALTKLEARPAPSGTMPVVIGSGSGGVLFHEACGHGLEADAIAKGASVFKGRRGQQVASPLVTLIDDGTMGEEWGCYAIDDEGTPAQRNVLIEDGVLTDYMYDFLRSRKEGRARSGNGRRESYQHLPMVRMTNTYVARAAGRPRRHRALDRAGCVRQGTRRRPGQPRHRRLRVRHDRGVPDRERRDHRSAARGQPHRQRAAGAVTLIDAVGNDFAMGPPGMCGKDGQGVPVGDGVPTLRVTALTIGGTAA